MIINTACITWIEHCTLKNIIYFPVTNTVYMIPHYAIAWMTKLHPEENLGSNYSSMAESRVNHMVILKTI